MRYLALGAALLLPMSGAVAQISVPGDPYADDPVGIVADPCPVHPAPVGADGSRMWILHMLTREHGQLCRYAAQNAAITTPVRVVFLGDSITENWNEADSSLFTDGIVDRGISGQTTPQMLERFRQDVLSLHPRAVHIMAGTNDIAGNTGAATMDAVQGNIESMAELARLHGIKVILGSVLPTEGFTWNPTIRGAPQQITALNTWLRGYAKAHGYIYVDYHAALVGAKGGLKPGLSKDGVHPTPSGYALMRPLALAAISKALRSQ